jgi:hypothetical protein
VGVRSHRPTRYCVDDSIPPDRHVDGVGDGRGDGRLGGGAGDRVVGGRLRRGHPCECGAARRATQGMVVASRRGVWPAGTGSSVALVALSGTCGCCAARAGDPQRCSVDGRMCGAGVGFTLRVFGQSGWRVTRSRCQCVHPHPRPPWWAFYGSWSGWRFSLRASRVGQVQRMPRPANPSAHRCRHQPWHWLASTRSAT